MNFFSPKRTPTSQHHTKGFTLIELLVVIAIISLLSSIVMVATNSGRAKARDAKRMGDMQQIVKGLEYYNNNNGCLPITSGSVCPGNGGYNAADAGGYDYSSQGGQFLSFLTVGTDAYFSVRSGVDPVNNMTGDGTPSNTYAYRYSCSNSAGNYGVTLGYWDEYPTYQYVPVLSTSSSPSNVNFRCI